MKKTLLILSILFLMGASCTLLGGEKQEAENTSMVNEQVDTDDQENNESQGINDINEDFEKVSNETTEIVDETEDVLEKIDEEEDISDLNDIGEEELVEESIEDDKNNLVATTDCYVDFANNLEQCNVGFVCNFMHPLTGQQLERRVVSAQNGLCKIEEDMPNNGLLSCSLADNDLKKAMAKMYKDMSSGNYEAEVDTSEDVNVYIVDGKTIENPLDEAVKIGVCTVSGY